jgi:hypothetical protein
VAELAGSVGGTERGIEIPENRIPDFGSYRHEDIKEIELSI